LFKYRREDIPANTEGTAAEINKGKGGKNNVQSEGEYQ
jgi:hypothetical protein